MNINRAIFSGNLVDDIQLVALEGGSIEGHLRVAVNEFDRARNKITTWVSAVILGNRARALQDELFKGRQISIDGKLRTRSVPMPEGKFMNFIYIEVIEIDFDPKQNVARRAPPSQPAQQ